MTILFSGKTRVKYRYSYIKVKKKHTDLHLFIKHTLKYFMQLYYNRHNLYSFTIKWFIRVLEDILPNIIIYRLIYEGCYKTYIVPCLHIAYVAPLASLLIACQNVLEDQQVHLRTQTSTSARSVAVYLAVCLVIP